MTRSAAYNPLLRFRCDVIDHSELEWTQDRVHLSRVAVCGRAGLLGVPLRIVDVLMDARVDPTATPPVDEALLTVLEVGERRGRYSGDVRDRLTWRAVDVRDRAYTVLEWAQVEVDRAPGATTVTLRSGDGTVRWERIYPSLRWVFDHEADSSRIVWWHWEHHFRFLPRDEVRQVADSWTLSAAVKTISEANRLAQRELYALARQLGWRKMTKRERLRLWGPEGADRGQWHRESEVAAWLSETGCGEATVRAAGGGTLDP